MAFAKSRNQGLEGMFVLRSERQVRVNSVMRVQKNIPGRCHSMWGSMASKMGRKVMWLERGRLRESGVHEAEEGSRCQSIGHVCESCLFSNH